MTPMIVSVVIPCSADNDVLAHQLSAVLASTRPNGVSEIDVVLSWNSNRPHDQIDKIHVPDGWKLTVVDSSDRAGAAHARNIGWRASKGSVVLFTDDDDEVRRDWICEMTMMSRSYGVFGGILEYGKLNPPETTQSLDRNPERLHVKCDHLPYVAGTNVGFRRDVLEELNGWSEDLLRAQDVDICWRAQYLGYELGHSTEAVVHYRLRGSYADIWHQAKQSGIYDGLLVSKHKKYGAGSSIRSNLRELAVIGVEAIWSIWSVSRRRRLTYRLGIHCGHIIGLWRWRVWAG